MENYFQSTLLRLAQEIQYNTCDQGIEPICDNNIWNTPFSAIILEKLLIINKNAFQKQRYVNWQKFEIFCIHHFFLQKRGF